MLVEDICCFQRLLEPLRNFTLLEREQTAERCRAFHNSSWQCSHLERGHNRLLSLTQFSVLHYPILCHWPWLGTTAGDLELDEEIHNSSLTPTAIGKSKQRTRLFTTFLAITCHNLPGTVTVRITTRTYLRLGLQNHDSRHVARLIGSFATNSGGRATRTKDNRDRKLI